MPFLNAKIKEAGKRALKKLIQEPSLKIFTKTSIEFVKEINILEILNLTKIDKIMNDLNKLKIFGASMNQLGRSIFAICKNKDVPDVIEIFESYKPDINLIKTSISNKGPRVINFN